MFNKMHRIEAPWSLSGTQTQIFDISRFHRVKWFLNPKVTLEHTHWTDSRQTTDGQKRLLNPASRMRARGKNKNKGGMGLAVSPKKKWHPHFSAPPLHES